MKLVARINALTVPGTLYEHPEGWHVTLGDSDLDH
jgi:hypothetical protein